MPKWKCAVCGEPSILDKNGLLVCAVHARPYVVWSDRLKDNICSECGWSAVSDAAFNAHVERKHPFTNGGGQT